MMPTFLTSLRLDSRLAEPLYRQIYLRIKDAIARGNLGGGQPAAFGTRVGERSGRGARHGGKRLCSTDRRRFLQSRGQAGTYVSPQLPPMQGRRPLHRRCRRWRPIRCSRRHAAAFPTGRAGAGCVSTCAVAAHCRPPAARFYGGFLALPPAGGLPELREAIAHYLHLSRGISCQPEQIAPATRRCWTGWWRRCCTPVTQYGLKIPVIRLRARCCGPPA